MKNWTNKFLSMLLALVMLTGVWSTACAELTDGTFEGTAAGMGGDVKISVTVENGSIRDVTVLEENETDGISDPALETIPSAIVAANSAEVEAIAGATVTSNAIMSAVSNALNGIVEQEAEEVIVPFDRTDVIVVGAGIGGLSAAVRASELGANVVLIEQSGRVGASGLLSGGSLVGVNTAIEKENGIEDSVELMLEDFERLGGKGNNDPVLAKTFAENCGRAVDWLDTYVGVDFGDRQPTYGGYVALNVPRVHYAVPENGDVSLSSGKGGSGYVKALSAKIEEGVQKGNVCLMLDTKVTDVTYDGEKVTGVTAVNAFGERSYEASAVILACGGYGGNEEMLKTYNFKNVLTTCADTASGDGYTFALKLGAALSGMDWVSAYAGGINTGTFHKVLSANLYTNKQPIWVTMEGNRLTNEPSANSTDQSNAWNAASENLVYVIFNDAMIEEPCNILYGVGDLQAAWDEQLALGENIWEAESVEELAQKAGIDTAGLAATVDAYNEACAGKAEDPFGRTENMISFADGGKIYAVKTMPYVMMTNGGVAMNENGNIIREDGTPIAGLYQCGEQVGSDNIAGHSSVGGMAHGNCVTWGMISAENAVSYAAEQ